MFVVSTLGDLLNVDEGVKKLYVGNIPYETTDVELNEFFSEHGKVHDVYMPKNNDGSPRGFAFVGMKQESVDELIEATNGVDFKGRPIVVSLPLPPGEKGRRMKREISGKLRL